MARAGFDQGSHIPIYPVIYNTHKITENYVYYTDIVNNVFNIIYECIFYSIW